MAVAKGLVVEKAVSVCWMVVAEAAMVGKGVEGSSILSMSRDHLTVWVAPPMAVQMPSILISALLGDLPGRAMGIPDFQEQSSAGWGVMVVGPLCSMRKPSRSLAPSPPVVRMARSLSMIRVVVEQAAGSYCMGGHSRSVAPYVQMAGMVTPPTMETLHEIRSCMAS
jgi:hypothetical protein